MESPNAGQLPKLSSPELVVESPQSELPPTSVQLPSIAPNNLQPMDMLGQNKTSVDNLLKTMHSDILSALEETQTVTTHDNNLEKQYRQTVEENIKLNAHLYRARREITRLKGELAMLQLAPSEIREERYHQMLQQKKRHEQEIQLQEKQKNRKLEHLISVLSYQERAQTVNAYGNYIVSLHKSQKQHKRTRTFPLSQPSTSPKKQPLPPVLKGCQCSVCNSQQSLGAFTLGKGPVQLTKSGQQILLGDRVVVHGDQLGIVKYIGKLEFDQLDRMFIGIHLDIPLGITDGTVRGRRYFQCPPSHGVFVLPHNITCVTGRKPQSSTALPRAKQRPMIFKESATATHQTTNRTTPLRSHTPNSLIAAEQTVEREIQILLNEKQDIENLINPSVSEMSKRMIQLQSRPRHSTPPIIVEDKESIIVDENKESEHKEDEVVTEPVDQSVEETDVPNELTISELVLTALQQKDLSGTGYVTIKELNSILVSNLKLTPAKAEAVIKSLGLENAEGRGIEYAPMALFIAKSICKLN